MARPDVNRFGEMEVFIRVVETGGFTAAAQQCRLTPSAVSKLVARLEDRLGTRLFNRSTRRQQLTAEGAAFYERSLRILADLDEAEREVSASAEAQGRVRVSCNLPVGRQFLIPALPLFFERYPGVTLDLQLTDEVVDLLEVRADVAVRSGPLRDSRLVARSLGESGHKIVAAPEYLVRYGTPQHPRELGDYNCVGFSYRRVEPDWPFLGKQVGDPEPSGNLLASDGDSVRHLALAGLGLARLAEFQVRGDIAAGRLVEVLADFNPGDRKPMHALYLGKPGHLPARVRVVLDFLAEHVRID